MNNGFDTLNGEVGLYDPQFEHDSCGVGLIADIVGRPSHQIVRDSLSILVRLNHRGARGAEENTGDGAGILTQIPHDFFAEKAEQLGIQLPEKGDYAVGMLFMPSDNDKRRICEEILLRTIEDEGQLFLGWRDVPTNNSTLGDSAKSSEPFIRQVFIGKGSEITDSDQFERKLYVIRRWAKELMTREEPSLSESFYAASFSSKTIVYKGMLTTEQVSEFYPDLSDPNFKSALALVHSRFSTNTVPNWNRAQPLRYIAHNGEINTLRGNVNWMSARETRMSSPLFGDDLQKVMHVVDYDSSDSGAFDNSLEFLTLAGRELPHSMMMMVPEPMFEGDMMSDEKRVFYRFHSCLTEAWDGPASITFTDGDIVGGVLDRNGLRPSRYCITDDGLVVMASETGVLDIKPEKILKKGRLQPGKMFLIDTKAGRVIEDDEIKHRIATAQPYAEWLKESLVSINDIPDPPFVNTPDHETLLMRQRAFGYTHEEIRMLLAPMFDNGAEAMGAMGSDTPLAVLSEKPQLIYNYFKQLFAQVTNPPIDAIREEIVTSIDTMIGPEDNILDPGPQCARQIALNSFILKNTELEKLRLLGDSESQFGKFGFRSVTLPMLFDKQNGVKGLEWAIEELCYLASKAIADGYEIIILSDRQMSEYRVPIPALLAVSAVHHHLIKEGTRTHAGFVLESGEPREVHHFALLLGYGATAINPYLAFETAHDRILMNELGIDPVKAEKNYIKAVNKGVVKILSKMGISTIQSYLGAQVFECLGLNEAFVKKYFTRTPTRIGGIGVEEIAEEAIDRHSRAFFPKTDKHSLAIGGNYQWRREGEAHRYDPETIHLLQRSCRTGDYKLFKQYTKLLNSETRKSALIRGLMSFKPQGDAIPIEKVEPVDSILKRFKTGAMSYGSISAEAHETLAVAMNRIGGRSNTGEGGEDEERFRVLPNGDRKISKIKQVASGRFGVTSNYLVNAEEIQIKVAQGAKPGEGGQLPGGKIYPWIAKTRHSTPGVGLISPPPHHDIYSIEDLSQLIFDLKNANEKARISVKLVSEAGVGTVAAGVAKAKAEVILISGADGGTGAAPQTSIKHAGIPWEIGLAEAHQTLLLNNLRGRVILETDGQLMTGRDVVIAALLGAEEFGFSTAPLVTLGCVLMRVCHLNTCPVGIATQDPQLRNKFSGDPQYVINFMRFIAEEMREYMAQLGFHTIDEMIGRTDSLQAEKASHGIDLSKILFTPNLSSDHPRKHEYDQDFELETTLDKKLLAEICKPAVDDLTQVKADLLIKNTDRTVGTLTGSLVSSKYGSAGLPEDTIDLKFYGSAGQSFGAFLPKGMTLTLEGDANDYIGKGLSGGKIIVYPDNKSVFRSHENIIIGNTAFYGATGGKAYISGLSGERFAVRNSGMHAVIEGVGDHACEYMTGGSVIILGEIGKNFAAGMSGGVAYVFDPTERLMSLTNKELVEIDPLADANDIVFLTKQIEEHISYTNSQLAIDILANIGTYLSSFKRVIPTDYRLMKEAQKELMEKGFDRSAAELEAFKRYAA